MEFNNFNTLDNQTNIYKNNLNKVGEISIPIYNGNIWDTNENSQKIMDGSKEKLFKSFESLIKFFDKEININIIFINEDFKSRIISFVNNIIDYSSYEDYAENINSQIESLKSEMISYSIVLSDSNLFRSLKANGLLGKNEDFQDGFKKAFQNISNVNLKNNSEIEGFKYGLDKIGKKYEPEAYDELALLLDEYKKDYGKFNKKIKETDEWSSNLEKLLKKRSNENKKKVELSIQDLLEQKRKLMLSGPLKMWYDRLSEYDGGAYIKKINKDFRFIHIPYKTLKNKNIDAIKKEYHINGKIDEEIKFHNKIGKIKKSFYWMICFAIFGLMAVIFGISLPIVIFNEDLWSANKKLIITISLMASFSLFIYGYVLKILVKNWVSTRHISEEINERISLTQFYLTLIDSEEANINNDNISFALTEIFKRINTGLLKEDSTNRNSAIELLNLFKNK